MEELLFKIIEKENISDKIAAEFTSLLEKQGKVTIPSIDKIKSCLKIVVCYKDGIISGIGALKTKSSSDFNERKSDLQHLEPNFEWELGYFYVDESHRNYGISNMMTKLLLKKFDDENLMATTELFQNNPMKYVLEKYGFRQHGKPWASTKHNGTIGLFLRFKQGKAKL